MEARAHDCGYPEKKGGEELFYQRLVEWLPKSEPLIPNDFGQILIRQKMTILNQSVLRINNKKSRWIQRLFSFYP
jgi:hypothetical protein